MKFWCLCKTFNDHLNYSRVVMVCDKLHCYQKILNELMITSTRDSKSRCLPLQWNVNQGELFQLKKDIKKYYTITLSTLQRHMAVVYGGFRYYREKTNCSTKRVNNTSVWFHLFSH